MPLKAPLCSFENCYMCRHGAAAPGRKSSPLPRAPWQWMGNPGPAIQPVTNASGGGNYASLEPLVTSATLVWEDDKGLLLGKIRGLGKVTMKRAGLLIGSRTHNGLRNRAPMRFLSWSCLLGTLKMTALRERQTDEVVDYFEMMVSPSMKSVDYRLAIVFKDGVY